MKTTRKRVIAVLKEVGDLMKLAKSNSGKGMDMDVIRMWDILTALRGPDAENEDLKELTTARVRSTIGVPVNDYVSTSTERPVDPSSFEFQTLADRQWHFKGHYTRAYVALQNLGLGDFMMKLTVPKKGGNLYYVSSESKPDQKEASHIVVRIGNLFFCDCRDFFVRRLTNLGTQNFDLCKHGEFVRDVVGSLEPDEQLVEAVRKGPGKRRA